MSLRLIKKLTYLYLTLPLFVFCFTWFIPAFKVLLLIFLCFSCASISIPAANDFRISRKVCWAAFFISAFWCFWSGIGGYVYQTGDFLARNAIYHDLIEQSYPVYYTAGYRTLNYYFGFWLIPALLSKIFAGIDNPEILFTIGLNILLLHAIIGVFLFFLLFISLIKPKGKKALFLTLIFPLLFSGLDVVPALINQTPFDHIEVWNGIGSIQYDSQTTQLFWVFNQAIPAWLATLLFLDEKTPRNYGIIFIATLFQGVLPALGLGIFMTAVLIKFWLEGQRKTETYKQIFSYSNLTAVPLLLVLIAFFTCNTVATRDHFHITHLSLWQYVTFCAVEFLCYVLPIYRTFKHELVFRVMSVSLMGLVLFSIGGEYNDFPMRTTIPALLILEIYVLRYLSAHDTSRFNKKILGILLIIGMMTPAVEFSRGVKQIAATKSISHRMDLWKTLNGRLTVFPWHTYLLSNHQNYKLYQYLIVPYQRPHIQVD